jgi:hypothetical protein
MISWVSHINNGNSVVVMRITSIGMTGLHNLREVEPVWMSVILVTFLVVEVVVSPTFSVQYLQACKVILAVGEPQVLDDLRLKNPEL